MDRQTRCASTNSMSMNGYPVPRSVPRLALALACVTWCFVALPVLAGSDQSPKNAAEVSLEVCCPETPGVLVPGNTYQVDVDLKDKRGRSYQLSDGNVRGEYLRLTAEGVNLSSDGRSFTVPAGDLDAMEAEGASIHVRYGKSANKIVEDESTFAIDVAAVRGPAAADVRKVSFDLGSSAGQRLVPGKSYEIRSVTVTDAAGRVYSLGDEVPRIDPERLVWSTDGLMLDAAKLTFVASTDEAFRAKPYALSLGYVGSDVRAEVSRPADFAAAYGPEPDQVASLEAKLKSSVLAPGETSGLIVTVKDQQGRTYRSDSATFRVPWDRLQVETVKATFKNGKIQVPGGCEELLYDKPKVRVRYAGAPAMMAEIDIDISLRKLLSSFFHMDNHLLYQGRDGLSGRSGRDGMNGRRGSGSTATYGSGGSGYPGDMGSSGTDGGRGMRGPRVEVQATKVAIADRSEYLLLGQVKVDGVPQVFGGQPFFLRPANAGALRVVSVGGSGGGGGEGGDGGDGGEGGKGYSPGSGGAGGPGGSGGNGGAGDSGGPVSILLAQEELRPYFQGESRGGTGGFAGSGGRAGSGGSSGSMGAGRMVMGILDAAAKGYSGQAYTPPPARPGRRGPDGMPGRSGMQGMAGSSGIAQTLVQSQVASQLRNLVPENLASCLWFED